MGYEYRRNEAIIRSKTREFFGVGTVVTATSYLVPVVDFMLIGILLGADAVAAAGLGDSFVDIAELPGFVLSAGGPVVVDCRISPDVNVLPMIPPGGTVDDIIEEMGAFEKKAEN